MGAVTTERLTPQSQAASAVCLCDKVVQVQRAAATAEMNHEAVATV